VAIAGTAGHARSTFVTAALAMLWAAVAWYVAWAADPRAREYGDAPYLLWQPQQLWTYALDFYENGAWTLGTGGGATPVSGMFLGLVWAIEAGTILWCARKVALSYSASSTYCEQCSRWIDEQKDVRRLSMRPEDQPTLERLLSGEVSAAANMPRAAAEEPIYLRLDLTCCPSCQQSDFLTVNLVTHEPDKKGNLTEKVQPLADRLAIAHADVEAVRQAGFEPQPEPPAAAEPPAAPQTG
jgi:hypothetical protein